MDDIWSTLNKPIKDEKTKRVIYRGVADGQDIVAEVLRNTGIDISKDPERYRIVPLGDTITDGNGTADNVYGEYMLAELEKEKEPSIDKIIKNGDKEKKHWKPLVIPIVVGIAMPLFIFAKGAKIAENGDFLLPQKEAAIVYHVDDLGKDFGITAGAAGQEVELNDLIDNTNYYDGDEQENYENKALDLHEQYEKDEAKIETLIALMQDPSISNDDLEKYLQEFNGIIKLRQIQYQGIVEDIQEQADRQNENAEVHPDNRTDREEEMYGTLAEDAQKQMDLGELNDKTTEDLLNLAKEGKISIDGIKKQPDGDIVIAYTELVKVAEGQASKKLQATAKKILNIINNEQELQDDKEVESNTTDERE